MKKTFKEELEVLRNSNINMEHLMVAYTVSWMVVYSDVVDSFSDDIFESICNCVNKIYLSLDNNYSLANIVEAVINLHYECGKSFEEINNYMVIGYIQDSFL